MPTVVEVVKTRADGSFSTAPVRGLSLQIIDEMNLLVPNILVSIDDLDVSGNETTVNFFLQQKAKDALRRAIRRRGKTLRLNSVYRSVVQQHLLFSWQGTPEVPLAAKPGRSNHEDGFAIDTPDWEDREWRNALEAEGWDWFGPGDEVHFTYVGGGVLDDVSDTGVKAFQILWDKHNPGDLFNLRDGLYGPETAAKLNRSPTAGFAKARILKLLVPPLQGEDVQKVQRALSDLGFLDAGQITGIYDAATKLAVEIFQKKEGLTIDGQVGPQTRRALKISV